MTNLSDKIIEWADEHPVAAQRICIGLVLAGAMLVVVIGTGSWTGARVG